MFGFCLLLYIVHLVLFSYSFFFFFNQKTAYYVRISDWSSDVCSSDLNDVAGQQRFRAKQRVQPLRLRCGIAPEVIDPDAGIDEDHPSVLMASRSPAQVSLPRNLRISSCLRSRSNVRKPSSTAR